MAYRYRLDPLVAGQVYHVFNRGVEKRPIVVDGHDRQRWLERLDYYRFVDVPLQFSLASPDQRKKLGGRLLVRILAYCLMPNHFHILLDSSTDVAISTFMRKFTVSYSRYFNQRHQRSGHLFQGPFQARLVASDELLLHISRYIHLNPLVAGLTDDLPSYRWSSYPDYLLPKKPSLCDRRPVLQHFTSAAGYAQFVTDHADYARSLEIIKHSLLD